MKRAFIFVGLALSAALLAAEPNPDSVSAASTLNYYLKGSLTGAPLLDALRDQKGVTTLATVNEDGTPDIASCIAIVVDGTTLSFNLSDNQTRENIVQRRYAAMSYLILDPAADDRSKRYAGARLVLEYESDPARIQALLARSKAKEGTVFMRILRVIPLG